MTWIHLAEPTQQRRVVRSLEHINEHYSDVRSTEYLDFLHSYERLKKEICLTKLAKFSYHSVIALELAYNWTNLTNYRGGIQHLFFPS
jgi:hypothetical protein